MSNKSTSDFFDSYAHDFNAIYGNKNSFINRLINELFRKSMRIRFEKTIEGCYPIKDKSVIDIGCGPGHFGVTLAKKGAELVHGIDFAESMIKLAEENAESAGVGDKCNFSLCDFISDNIEHKYDYSIVMGFMDYMENPLRIIEKVLSITKSKAFFSFPADGGILAWQRKLRYKKRCELFMYDKKELYKLIENTNCKDVKIEKISRDFIVTVSM